jgi:hypothetical protein
MRPKKTEIPWREDRERAPRATMAAGASRCRISGQRGQPDNDWQQTLGVTPMMVSCSCGQVECEATGAPIVTVACYCDDCQEGSRQIEELPNARAFETLMMELRTSYIARTASSVQGVAICCETYEFERNQLRGESLRAAAIRLCISISRRGTGCPSTGLALAECCYRCRCAFRRGSYQTNSTL